MTEGHLRHLSAVMRRLAETMLELVYSITPSNAEIDFAVYKNDVSPARISAILDIVASIRNEIAEISQQYGLHFERVSDRRRFTAKLALIEIELEGSTSRRMAGYGSLTEAEGESLDRQVSRIMDKVVQLCATIDGGD